MKTLYNAYIDCQEEGKFMEFLNLYFSVNDVYMKLKDDNVDVADCIEVLKMPVLSAKPKIARLLESYDKKPSVNYVSGVVRLTLGEYDDPDGRSRLEYALTMIKNRSSITKDQRHELFDKTYDLLDSESRDAFISTWINCIRDDVKHIYKRTHSSLASDIILEDVTKGE